MIHLNIEEPCLKFPNVRQTKTIFGFTQIAYFDDRQNLVRRFDANLNFTRSRWLACGIG